MLESLRRDLAFAVRALTGSPGFTVVAVTTLALGIGANVAIFSAVDGMMLESLPYRDPDRVMWLWSAKPSQGWTDVGVSAPDFDDWRERNQVFEDLALVDHANFNLSGSTEPLRLAGMRVMHNVFSVLGRQAERGRAFLPDDDAPGAPRVAVLAYELWQNRFAGDDSVIGRELTINGEIHTVVGVMPSGFFFPGEEQQIWVADSFADERESRTSRGNAVIGRLRRGVTVDAALANLNQVADALAAEHPDQNTGWGVAIESLLDNLFGAEMNLAFGILVLAVAFVVLIACANVASLMLARATRREREIAIRVSMGAGRRRLLTQLLGESLVVALLGGTAGLVVAQLGIVALRRIAPADAPRIDAMQLDTNVLLYALAVTLATVLVFGLLPALQASKPDLTKALKDGGQRGGGGRHRLLKTLVGAEVGLALVLLALGTLMVRSFQAQMSYDPGFDPKPLLNARVTLAEANYPEPTDTADFFDRALAAIRRVPGVESAAAVNTVPLAGSNSWINFMIEGRPPVPRNERQSIGYLVTSRDYFETFGIARLAGTFFDARSEEHRDRVAVINETMRRQHFAADDPVGARIRLGYPPPDETAEDAEESWYTIIGVADDVRHRGITEPARPELYVPYYETNQRSLSLIVRASGDPAALAVAVRRAIWEVDPNQPVYDLDTVSRLIERESGGPRIMAQILGTLASGALLLAAVGIYGVLSFAVSERSYEIGIRRAIGAQSRDIWRLVWRQTATPIAIGASAGLALAVALGQGIRVLLEGVSPIDLVSYVTTLAMLIAASLLAAWVPARRALRVDPLRVLRAE